MAWARRARDEFGKLAGGLAPLPSREILPCHDLRQNRLARPLARGVSGNKEWREARPGQQTTPRAELVAAVRRIVEAGR